jgi:hypothetical protein
MPGFESPNLANLVLYTTGQMRPKERIGARRISQPEQSRDVVLNYESEWDMQQISQQ